MLCLFRFNKKLKKKINTQKPFFPMSGTSLPHHTVSALFAFQYKTLRSLNIRAERLFQCLCFCDFVHLFQSTQCPLSNIQQQERVEGTRWGWIGKRTLCSFTARSVVELLRTTVELTRLQSVHPRIISASLRFRPYCSAAALRTPPPSD